MDGTGWSDMENLQAHPGVEADLAKLAPAINSVIEAKSAELSAWLGELILGMGEPHQTTPNESAAWRDGLVGVFLHVWQERPDADRALAQALLAAWEDAANAAATADAPPAPHKVLAGLADLQAEAEAEAEQ
jgi:hypothetical protein